MLGRTHVLSAAVVFLAAAPLLHTTPAGTVGGTAVAAAAGLLPDLDHPNSTIAHTLGPITGVLARVVARLSGGHRHGTHSLIGVTAFTLLTAWIVGRWHLPALIPVAVAVGAATHVAGDALTPQGVPLLWPLRWRLAVPVVPRTGGLVERAVVAPALALTGLWLVGSTLHVFG
jgi:membrane-bound metal-dependent hydrolase YbcI (DUF457 family)